MEESALNFDGVKECHIVIHFPALENIPKKLILMLDIRISQGQNDVEFGKMLCSNN